jgi:hypothetical protein
MKNWRTLERERASRLKVLAVCCLMLVAVCLVGAVVAGLVAMPAVGAGL